MQGWAWQIGSQDTQQQVHDTPSHILITGRVHEVI